VNLFKKLLGAAKNGTDKENDGNAGQELLGAAKAGAEKEIDGNPMQELLGAVTGEGGVGLQDLIEKFSSSGAGDLVQSWVSKGQNLPISSEQIEKVLGNEKVQEIASKLGIDPSQASNQLSEWLPKIVDKLTPNGRVEG
jgi:uncharacterized protein YidB (DUF937 family)